MKNFRTYHLAIQFYEQSHRLKIKNSILRDQFQRASLSIALNIAEGSGKFTLKDRRKFYSISMGSLRETQALLKLLGCKDYDSLLDQLGAHLYKLIQNPGSMNGHR